MDVENTDLNYADKYPNWNNWLHTSYSYNITDKGPELMKFLDEMLKNRPADKATPYFIPMKTVGEYEERSKIFSSRMEKDTEFVVTEENKNQK